MDKFTVHTGQAMPLRRSNVDTDQIIPAVYLKRVSRTGFEDGLFAAWRANEPDFVLNQDRFARATILVAGPDFGIGSSREHAVWALLDYGFKAVISPAFADIFRNNCTKSGLVPVRVDAPTGSALMKAVTDDPALEVTIDIERRTVSAPAAGIEGSFELDDFTRHRLLEGLDDIGLTLRFEADIDAYEATRPGWMPELRP